MPPSGKTGPMPTQTRPIPSCTAPIYTPQIQTLLHQRLAPYPAQQGGVYAVGSILTIKGEQSSFTEDMNLWKNDTHTRPTPLDLYEASTDEQDRLAAPWLQAFGSINLINEVRTIVVEAYAKHTPDGHNTFHVLCLRDGILIFDHVDDTRDAALFFAKSNSFMICDVSDNADTNPPPPFILAIHPETASAHQRVAFVNTINAFLRAKMGEFLHTEVQV